MSEKRVTLIQKRLEAAFSPESLEVIDESHKHIGHVGAKGGGGHFQVHIVAEAFTDKKVLERHRMVYQALAEEMKTEIHALGIQAFPPSK